MSLDGISIKKGKIGSNTISSSDGISGLIIACLATGALAHGIVKTIYNTIDAENLGLNEAFDINNNVNAFRHISEFYRMKGDGQKLFIMLVPDTTTMVSICEDSNEEFAKKILIEAGGEIRRLAIAMNPETPVTALDGIANDVHAAIPKAQLLHDWSFERFMPCQIFLEGHHYSGGAASSLNLRSLSAPKVSVMIGQDWQHAETKTGEAQKYADIGTMLGVGSASFVNQNIGDNEVFNLTDINREIWVKPALSNHKTNKEVFSDLSTLNTKGYIFGVEYTGLGGARFNDDHTCIEIIKDANGNVNEHSIAFGETADKAVRELRKALLPKVKSDHAIDASTGKLPLGVIKNFEGVGDGVFADMVRRKEITFGKMYVDPQSDLVTEKVLKTSFTIIPRGSVGEISGTINLKSNL